MKNSRSWLLFGKSEQVRQQTLLLPGSVPSMRPQVYLVDGKNELQVSVPTQFEFHVLSMLGYVRLKWSKERTFLGKEEHRWGRS